MGQRDPRVGCASRGGGDPGHDLERHSDGREGLDLLAPPPEDERVAALQPQHPLSVQREPGEEIVDPGLRDRMAAGLLPRVDALGVAPRQIEHRLRYQTVVDDDVRSLHEPQRPEGEQVGVSRPGPDQVDLAGRAGVPAFGERGLERGACLVLASREHLLSHRAVHDAFEEPAAPRRVGDPPEHGGPDFAHEPGEPPEPGRDDGFQAGAQDAGQDGGDAARRDRGDQGRAVEDRRQDERAQRTPIDDVDGDAPPPRGVGDGAGERVVACRDDREPRAVEVVVAKLPPAPHDPGLAGQLSQLRGEGRRDHDEPRAGPQQQPRLGRRHRRAAGEQAGLASEVHKDRQIVHGWARLAPDVMTGRPFEPPGRARSRGAKSVPDRAGESISRRRWIPSMRPVRRTRGRHRRNGRPVSGSRTARRAEVRPGGGCGSGSVFRPPSRTGSSMARPGRRSTVRCPGRGGCGGAGARSAGERGPRVPSRMEWPHLEVRSGIRLPRCGTVHVLV